MSRLNESLINIGKQVRLAEILGNDVVSINLADLGILVAELCRLQLATTKPAEQATTEPI